MDLFYGLFVLPVLYERFLPRPPHRVWGDSRRRGWHVMEVLCSQSCESCTGNKKSKLSVRWRDHLEAAEHLHCFRGHVEGGAARQRHLRGWNHRDLWSSLSHCTRMKSMEVHRTDLGHAGSQVAEKAGPQLHVHPFTRGQEASDLSNALTETSSVLSQDSWVCVHSSCRRRHNQTGLVGFTHMKTLTHTHRLVFISPWGP